MIVILNNCIIIKKPSKLKYLYIEIYNNKRLNTHLCELHPPKGGCFLLHR